MNIRTGRLHRVPPPKKGLKLVGIRLRPDQVVVLRRLALTAAAERGTTRGDVSELVREALDAWLAKAAKR